MASTGLAVAALIACQLTVARAISRRFKDSIPPLKGGRGYVQKFKDSVI
jgi:hypothetical protein